VGRWAITNHFKRMATALAPTTAHPKLIAFLPQNLWPWVWDYLKFSFTFRTSFRTYQHKAKNGVYAIQPNPIGTGIRIAVAGDWGTGTDEAAAIATAMQNPTPDFTIHLGDVYSVGDDEEIRENCLGQKENNYDGVKWPHGSRGSFALNGNHEMYAKGGPYFDTFLTTLGLEGDAEGQVASFFCLEFEQWRIIAIDTGYNSVGWPILGANTPRQ